MSMNVTILQGLTKAQAVSLARVASAESRPLDSLRANSINALRKAGYVEVDADENVTATIKGVEMENFIYSHVNPHVRKFAEMTDEFGA